MSEMDIVPVLGQVVLTNDEMQTLVDEIGSESLVRKMFAALHRSRLGDPAGVIRRSPDGTIAHRSQRAAGELFWEILRGDRNAQVTADWWPIHREAWEYRLTEHDFMRKDEG